MSDRLLRKLFPNDVHHAAGLDAELRARMPQAGRVLDLGCGNNVRLAEYRTAECEVWGTDLQVHPELQSPEWFRLMREASMIPFPDAHFDTVVAVMVLEHVADPAEFLGEIARVLRPGGCFIGHTVSGRHYVTGIRRLIGLLPHGFSQFLVKQLYGRPTVDTFPAYYRLNRQGQIEAACKGSGLVPVGCRRYGDPGYFNFSRLLRGAAILVDWSLEKLGTGWGRLYFTITLRKDAQAQTRVFGRRGSALEISAHA